MDQKLTVFFQINGSKLLNINKTDFSDDYLSRDFIERCSFHDSEILDSEFFFCTFKHCNFNKTIFCNCKFRDCMFENCRLINCTLMPYINFFQTSFLRSDFYMVHFHFVILFRCDLIEIGLSKIRFNVTSMVDIVSKGVRSSDLMFDQEIRFFRTEEDFIINSYTKIKSLSSFQSEIPS